jgi:hypothetical protein
LALAGCALGSYDPSPIPPPVPPQYEGADAGTLAIEMTEEGCCYTDGAIRSVTVSDPWPTTWQINDGSQSRLPAGDYQLTFFEQVCNGNCDSLAAPTNSCTTLVSIPPGGRIELQVVFPIPMACEVVVP